jgi:Pyruvate/2-oxoacid:ferredoxin oxidoreductase gamma subunit
MVFYYNNYLCSGIVLGMFPDALALIQLTGSDERIQAYDKEISRGGPLVDHNMKCREVAYRYKMRKQQQKRH